MNKFGSIISCILLVFYIPILCYGKDDFDGKCFFYQKNVEIETNNPKASEYLKATMHHHKILSYKMLMPTDEYGSYISNKSLFAYKINGKQITIYGTRSDDDDGDDNEHDKIIGVYDYKTNGDTVQIVADIKDECIEYININKNTDIWSEFTNNEPVSVKNAIIRVSFLKQTGNPNIDKQRKIYSRYEVDIEPRFADGELALRKFRLLYLEDPYVEKRRDRSNASRVTATFTISKTGEIRNIHTGEHHASMTLYATDLINKMPRWIPATYNGKNVDVEYSQQIFFSDPLTLQQLLQEIEELSENDQNN